MSFSHPQLYSSVLTHINGCTYICKEVIFLWPFLNGVESRCMLLFCLICPRSLFHGQHRVWKWYEILKCTGVQLRYLEICNLGELVWPSGPYFSNINGDKNTSTIYVRSSINHNGPKAEATQVSINWWMGEKMWSIHTTKSCSALKRKEILTYAETWMNLEDTVLSGISQSQKDKYCRSPYSSQIHRERK